MDGEDRTRVGAGSETGEELRGYPDERRRKPEKDGWDKLDVILKVLTPVTVGLVGILISHNLDETRRSQEDYRIYTQLMSSREQAESALRKDMFKSIIGAFLGAEKDKLEIEDQVVNLELLAYNFHESLNLKPLFHNLVKQIEKKTQANNRDLREVQSKGQDRQKISPKEFEDYLKRLQKVAEEITRKQLMVLRKNQNAENFSVNLKEVPNEEGGKGLVLKKIEYSDAKTGVENLGVLEFKVGKEKPITRICEAKVLQKDMKRKELQVWLRVRTPAGEDSEEYPEKDVEATFWVGFFDFPMVDNTRLSHNQRCAVTLNRFPKDNDPERVAEVTLVCFPGEHASLKDKAFIDELATKLRKRY
jgi:hypothetical protein